MRILLVSDLHYSLPQLDWVVGAASDYDVVVIAGDSLNIRSSVPIDAQSVILMKYLLTVQSVVPVVVSSGNHDLTGPDGRGEQAALWLDEAREAGIPTDGETFALDETVMTVCAWWDGPAGKQDLIAQLGRDATPRPTRWIWVYHWPPIDSPTCWTGRRNYGDPDLRAWIGEYRPDFVLTGHVHESPFKTDGAWADRLGTTWVFNAGSQIGPVPAHIDLDLGRGVATWTSLLGVEKLALDQPAAPVRHLV